METPSHYQEAIFKHLENRGGNSAVIGVAGCGKTWTAIEGVGRISPVYSKLLGTFTTAIRDEFRNRGTARGFQSTDYETYNSFGWKVCLRNLKRKPELDKDKTQNILEFVTMKGSSKFYKFKGSIIRLISLFKALNIHSVEEDHYNVNTPDDADYLPTVMATFEESIRDLDHFDFDDQKYMPLHLGMPIPKFDQVLLDEFQDSCPVEMALMIEASRGGQFCGFGDPDQAIYGFKGATPDAFDKYIEQEGAIRLPLSICYRCPKAVIREAQTIVPRIEWAPGAIEGSVDGIKFADFMKRIKPGDMVLCRVTSELVRTCIEFMKAGISAKIDKVTNNQNLQIAGFITALMQYQADRTTQLAALRRDNEIIMLEDRVNTIKALADIATSSEQIKKIMANLFTDTKHNGVDLMTCHKSKGLQNKKVYLLRPDLLPHPASKKRAWMQAEEKRLKYVTITRAEEEFNYVT